MSNSFSKEERVAFENLLEGFHDALVMSKAASVYRTDQTLMERANNVLWRPQPYIATSIDAAPGTDIAATGFKDFTQLSVPAQINTFKTVGFKLTALELRDMLQEQRLHKSAQQKLASDINLALLSTASYQGSLVVKRTVAASGYDDVAQCDAIMNEQGVNMEDRYFAWSSRDYNGAASNLQVASRTFGNAKSDDAYERSYIGRVAGFDSMKLDYALRLTAAAGGAITINTATQFYTPAATTTSANGYVKINVDNRFQSVVVSATAGVKAGDAFTIEGVYAVHHITKQSTGQLKTFRVISVDDGTHLTITPPIISAAGATTAELEYQNVYVPAAGAGKAITWLNTADAYMNVFWQKDSLEILPGRLVIPADAGVAVLRGTTDQGLEIVLSKFQDINTNTTKYRVDTVFGTVNKNPEMSGLILFSQV